MVTLLFFMQVLGLPLTPKVTQPTGVVKHLPFWKGEMNFMVQVVQSWVKAFCQAAEADVI
jgi:hypothetical protein